MNALAHVRHGGNRRCLPCLLAAAFIAGPAAAEERARGADRPATHTVVIEAMRFSPRVLEVRSGDTVVWVNKDAFPHDATAGDRSFASPPIAAGARWEARLAQKGEHPYACTLHPTMKALLVVR